MSMEVARHVGSDLEGRTMTRAVVQPRSNEELLADRDWQKLVAHLHDNLDQLVANFLAELGSLANYAGGLVDREDVERTAHTTLEMLTLRLGGWPLREEHIGAARSVGIRRARQGVGRDHLFDAVRMDFRVIWSTLTQYADESMDAALVRNLSHVMAVVDEYVVEVQDAYLTESAILSQDSRLHTNRFVSRLFAADQTGKDVVDDIARALGVASDATFEVVHIGREGALAVQGALAHGTLDPTWLTLDREGGYLLFREQRGTPVDEFISSQPGGIIKGVSGLAAVPAAASSAARLAGFSRSFGDGLISWKDGWIAAAAQILEREIPGFGGEISTSLGACKEHDRERIVECVITFCRTGSVKATASRLKCHRNTVVNRLASFRELTGLDVAIPLQAATALVALAREPAMFASAHGRVTAV
ncbi:helix-turn-helix domain-containing protein [Saccharopolyspora pogona]|uniref:helix-turn-helix domain-containing protein n=1 Tax=Saccharopolyspora pogona TaxID=333966 RepID=UPI001681EC0B|nr:helix-turn-helix domain-containing protein [Saccharopolyspora pogona]